MLIEARRDKELELLKMDQSREEEKSGLQNRSLDINPADRVERPRKEQFVGSTYNQEELENLFETVKGDPIEFGVILAAFYGLRRSEVIGLKWDAIDFERKTFTICHTVNEVSVDGKHFLVEKDRTKTKSSHRTLSLISPFEALLLRMRSQQEENRKAVAVAITRKMSSTSMSMNLVSGLSLGSSPHTSAQSSKKTACDGFDSMIFRHSCASLLYANGVSLKEIQEWLGHSNSSTTSNIYTHLDYSTKVASANAILGVYPA